MVKRDFTLATVLLLGAAGLGGASSSQAAVNIDIDVAPPAVQTEVVPPPRVGFVWAPGYWEWRDHHHVWVAGAWMRERRGFHWVPAHWDERRRHWHFEPGHWMR